MNVTYCRNNRRLHRADHADRGARGRCGWQDRDHFRQGLRLRPHGHPDLERGQIKVREFPKLSATTDDIGDYKLKVPDDANVTPYIPSASGPLTRRNLERLQREGRRRRRPTGTRSTSRRSTPRGANLVNTNFQVPADTEYGGLKAILGVQADPDGRTHELRDRHHRLGPQRARRRLRDVRVGDRKASRPRRARRHFASAYPALGEPIYFTEQTIPLASQTETSLDGGIVWTEVPAGTYRIVTTSPTDRFASFLATCKPRRVVNANPPWGAYQLSKGEKPLAASNVAGRRHKGRRPTRRAG